MATAGSGSERSLLKAAYVAIQKLQDQLQAARRPGDEPIAVVGMACRFPGGDTPEAFWEFLAAAGDAVRDVPPDRWDVEAWSDPNPQAPGKSYSRVGAFLDGVERFDASLFGIAPREAATMDPQQGLLLETTWEAFEDAGFAPDRQSGSATGVFVGLCNNDYSRLVAERGHDAIDAYAGTGTSASVAAGRISYVFGLRGPCITIDTACSSALVAIHQACQALRHDECRQAVAGGVNLLFDPRTHVVHAKAHMLSPSGRCRTFDAGADGFVRGEGCGIVVLKRLADALADGDRVVAVIRGSAVNQDGHSSGLTAPNGPSQQDVIRRALAQAGVDAATVDYVEAHGTGTALGDPIEVDALNAVYGKARAPDHPLWIGSVKTNVGHLEAAAGVAGLIKVILAMRHESLPPHLHVTTPSPHIAWERMALRVCRDGAPWPRGDHPRLAGVSSFGFSGTNAHLVIEEPPRPAANNAAARRERSTHLLCLSAAQPAALRALASGYADWLDAHPEADAADFAYSANTGRSHLDHRAAIVFRSRAELVERLREVASGDAPDVVQGRATARPRLAFLFTGQGAQHAGMARKLYEMHPVFRDSMDASASALDGFLPTPLLDVIFQSGDALNQTGYTQPALFAIETALLALWRSWGIEPDVVLGHSVGEFAAACAAGIFGNEAALRLIAERGRLMQALPAGGAMAAVQADATRVSPFIAAAAGVSLAADNGTQTVISGPVAAVDLALSRLQAAGIRGQRLAVSHAFHSALMEPALDALEAAAAGVETRPPDKVFVSNLTGRPLDPGTTPDAGYWRRHAREPVRFGETVASLARLDCGVLVEVGPAPVLISLAQRAWPAGAAMPAAVSSLRPGRDDDAVLADALAVLYVHGATPDLAAWDRPWPRRRTPLPKYPFQRVPYLPKPRALPKQSAPASTDGLLFDVAWKPLSPPHGARPVPSGRWLIVASDRRWADALVDARDGAAVRLMPANGTPADWDAIVVADPEERWAGVMFLGAHHADASSSPASAEHATLALLDLIQALHRQQAPPPLWVVTSQAQSVAADDFVVPSQTVLWGLGRAALAELPSLLGGLIDVPQPEPGGVMKPEVAAALWAQIDSNDGEDQIALRVSATGMTRHVARLRPRRNAATPASALHVRSDARYLITGGLGVLGLHAARWLADRGAKSLVLLGRRAAPEGAAAEAIEALRDRGVDVRLVAVDVSDRAALEAALAEHRPLAGVIHGAGVADVIPLAETTHAALRSALAAKVAGAWNLHELTAGEPLDLFVCLSSIAAVWGGRGQAGYAAANAFLDGLAHYRRRAGLPGLSVAYGPWRGAGLNTGEARDWLKRSGLRLLNASVALEGLASVLGASAPHAVIVDAEWRRFTAVYQARRRRPLLSEIEGELPVEAATSPPSSEGPEDIPVDDRRAWIEALLDRTLTEVLHIAPDALDPLVGFFDLGMDSLTAVEFAQILARRIGRPLPNTLAMDQPNRGALTDFLMSTLFGEGAAAERPTADVAAGEPIAVIGLACRFPGANDPEAYWRLLAGGVDAIGEVPFDRWDVDAYYDPDPAAPGKMYTRQGGFLDQIDQFDAELFRITPREAMTLDPQQRLLLETAWEALHNGGQTPEELRGSRCGVYVGVGANEYGRLATGDGAGGVDAYFGTGNSLNVIAGRCAYALGLQGPAVALDTACSSSLVAVHQASLGLRSGDCDLALVGGVSLMVSPLGTIAACRAHMLAPDGRCKTFDASADGYGRGEGCGVVVLKRLSDARRDGDRILATLRGSAVNHDGASSGLTVPNGPAQEAVLQRALARAGVRPRDVSYVEAHGTGTALGDPIEVQALGAVFGHDRSPDRPLLIGSAKSQIGHLEAAAGMAGLIKVLLAMYHGKLPGQLHFNTPNPHIAWDSLPVRVVQRTEAWPEGTRVAGVSSFGFSGTNAHVVVEGGATDADAMPIAPASPYPFRRRRYWVEPPPGERTNERGPLLGTPRVSARSGETTYQARWDPKTTRFIAEHRVYGEMLVPGASYAAMALACAGLPARVLDLAFQEPMVFDAGRARLVQFVIAPPGPDGSSEFQVFSTREADPGRWVCHASGQVAAGSGPKTAAAGALSIAQLQSHLEPASAESVFQALETAGVELGPCFRAVQSVWRGNDQALAQLIVPPELSGQALDPAVHPALLDACTQVVGAARPNAEGVLFVPWRYERLELDAPFPPTFYSYARMRADTGGGDGESVTADLSFFDEAGQVFGRIDGFVLKRAPRDLLLRGTRAAIDDVFYDIRWDERHLPGPAFADDPTLPAGIAHIDPAAVLPEAGIWSRYRQLVEALDPLALAWVVQALQTLGWRPRVGDRVDAGALARELGIDARHERLWGRLLELLGDAGILGSEAGGFVVPAPVAAADPRAVHRDLERRYAVGAPDAAHELELLRTCGERLAEVLTGAADPLALLFPEDGVGSAEAVYRDGIGSRVLGRVIHEVVAAAASRLPVGRPLRVLEVGAGTGGATEHVLDALPAGSTYRYTDISPAYFGAARDRFAAWPFVTYETLDIERDPRDQGYRPQAFDLVVAANVLHATRDVDRSLSHLAMLVAPGGLCLILEGVQRRAWLDVTFGLLPGWWRFDDARRTEYPLLDRESWASALADHELIDMAAASVPAEPADQVVMVARRTSNDVSPAPDAGDTWLIFADAGGLADGLVERMGDRRYVTVTPGATFAHTAPNRYVVPAGDREACVQLLDRVAGEGGVPRQVVYLWGLDVPGPESEPAGLADRAQAACTDLLAVVQALAGRASHSFAGLSIVTRGAQAMEDAPRLSQSPLLGLGTVIATEHPELHCRRIDLDPDAGPGDPGLVWAELTATDDEDQVAWRAESRRVPRLTRHGGAESRAVPLAFEPDRSYLITGGLGGLGLAVGGWMLDRGARHLVLLGRSAPGSAAVAEVEGLRARGGEICVELGDVRDDRDVRRVLDHIRDSMPPLHGVLHAAGRLHDAAVRNQNADHFADVLGAKVFGAWNLHRLTEDDELEFFVLFSSTAGVFGSWGQANHAAANVFLDALAHYRRARGLPAISIDWGPWSEIGAAARRGVETRMAGHGIGALSPAQGIAALERCLLEAPVQTVVARIDWERLAAGLARGEGSPLLRDVLGRVHAPRSNHHADRGKLVQRLSGLEPDAAVRALVARIQQQVTQVLRLGADARPDPNRGWFELGMDSLVIVELHHWLQGELGDACRLPATVAFELPTITALARHVVAAVQGGGNGGISDHADAGTGEEPAADEDLDGLTLDELAAQLDQGIAEATAKARSEP